MFRRREDSLFDENEQPAEKTEATQAKPSTAGAAPAAAKSQGAARPAATESRPSAPASSGNFRNNNPLSDLTRSRMPDSKSPLPSSSPATAMDKPGKTIRRVLTVGSDILLKGEIATCDRLVIEGKVDATLNDVHTVEITESGSFKGSAEIEDAEISGLFEGDLVVRGRLVIYGSGKVRGKITYGEIEIERGGELSGEIKSGPQAASSANSNRKAVAAA